MDLKLDVSKNTNGTVTVMVEGRLDSANSILLAECLEREIKMGHCSIIINLSAVDFLSSSGIRVLLQYYKEVRKKNGFLSVAQPSENVRKTLDMVGMAELFRHSVLLNTKLNQLEV